MAAIHLIEEQQRKKWFYEKKNTEKNLETEKRAGAPDF